MKMKYEIGDVAKVKDNLVVGKGYGDLLFVKAMAPFKQVTIKHFTECGWYNVEENKYVYSDEMLEED